MENDKYYLSRTTMNHAQSSSELHNSLVVSITTRYQKVTDQIVQQKNLSKFITSSKKVLFFVILNL